MAEISIDRSTFPQEGGSFKISITKDSASTWGAVTIPSAAWYEVGEMKDVSPYLYTIDVSVEENTSGASRTMPIGVMIDGQSELFNITQESAGALVANIVAYTGGNISASGGQVTADVQSVNGNDSLTSAAVTSGSTYCTLTSTTHGVTSGGVTCTRFVFTFDENTGSTARNATFTFTASDGNATASATLTKTQAGAAVQSGTLSLAAMSVGAGDTSAAGAITQTDMNTATLSAAGTAAWVTSAQVQIQGGQYVCILALDANTGAARTDTITITGQDIWGNTITATATITQGAAGSTHSISAAWRSALGYDGILSWEGGQEQALITFTGTFTGDTTISYGTLPEGVTIALANNSLLDAYYTGGNIAQTRVIPVSISRTGDDSVTYTAMINLTLAAGGVFPIWRDTFGTIVTDEDWEDYELYDDGLQFYAGRAFAYPDESNIRVKVSRVAAPYLTSYYKDVDMVSGDTAIGSYTFVRDYSYDTAMDYTQNQWLNRPVNGRVPSGVKLSAAMWGAHSGGYMQVADEGGSLVVNQAIVKGLNTGEWISGNAGKVYTIGEESYRVVDACRGALLKYVNAYGAVDFFLVEGVAKKSDKITRATYEKDAAALSSDYEGKDYQNEMVAEWTGTTGWLTDEQSLRMKNLVESVEVYMIDTQTGLEVPVQMTDNGLQYKTFASNGRKMVNYTLQWTESQKKIRR